MKWYNWATFLCEFDRKSHGTELMIFYQLVMMRYLVELMEWSCTWLLHFWRQYLLVHILFPVFFWVDAFMGIATVVVSLKKVGKPQECNFLFCIKSPTFPPHNFFTYTLFCVWPCSSSRGLKAWIATHPPMLYQKSEASARGFFGSLVHPLCSGLQKLSVPWTIHKQNLP